VTWGQITIGGVDLRETVVAESSSGSLKVTGQESDPPSTSAHVMATHHNIVGLRGLVVPVTFSDKSEHTGFYRVTDSTSTVTRWNNGSVNVVDWSLSLEPLGTERDVEFESRVPTIGRTDQLTGTQTPNFWHAPPVGITSYYTGTTVPASSIARTSSEGAVPVHLGIPTSFPPRWTVSAANYLNGSARLLFDGIRRVGTFTPPLSVWEMSNGLVRLMSGASGSVTVWCWDSGEWRSAKGFKFYAAADLTTAPEFTVLRNEPEEVAVRLSYPGTPGRTTVDLSLRRGARFVTGVIKRHSSAELGVSRSVSETGTAVTGGMRATSADADGNRYVVGSSRSVATSSGGAISAAGITTFDFFIGHEVNSSPSTGDAFADLLLQYLGSPGREQVRLVRR
jgi:hypothetical protein